MFGRISLVSCASLLLVQSISAQCLLPQASPCAYPAQPLYPAQPRSPCGANLGLGLPAYGSGANLELLPAYGNSNLGLALPSSFNGQVLSVVTGSALTPSSVNLLAENLEINGLVGVQGSAPFLATVGVAGEVPTGGQGLVSYSAGPGVALTSGGCGQGLELGGVSAYGSGLGLGNVGLAGGLGLANGLGLGASSCGCRY